MNKFERAESNEPPIGIAGLSCLTCFVSAWFIVSVVTRYFGVGWLVWPAAILASLTVTFIILYRSAWHRELPVFTRILSMLLSAVIVFVVVLLFAGLVLAGICVFLSGDMISS